MQDALDHRTRPGIQAIARAGRVLRALETAPGGLALAELAAAVKGSQATQYTASHLTAQANSLLAALKAAH